MSTFYRNIFVFIILILAVNTQKIFANVPQKSALPDNKVIRQTPDSNSSQNAPTLEVSKEQLDQEMKELHDNMRPRPEPSFWEKIKNFFGF